MNKQKQPALKEDFSRLKVKGFRRLCDIDIPIRPLSVIIGANGVGKTSLLDAIDLLATSANGGLNKRLSDLSGIAALVTIDKAREMAFGLETTSTGHKPLNYELAIEAKGTAYTIASEVLSQPRGDGSPFPYIDSHFADVKYFDTEELTLVRPTWDHNPLETSLSQVPKMYKQPENFRKRLGSSTFYHVLNIDPRAPVRLPQLMRPAGLPG